MELNHLNDINSPSISVIVPVYNVGKYFSPCINSILSQSFQDFELILVDDSSSDGSGELCDAFAAASNKICVIHQKHQGVSAARNKGLSIARGKYLSFIDADDVIEEDMYLIMYSEAEKGGYDVVACGEKHFDEFGNHISEGYTQEVELDRDGMLKAVLQVPSVIGVGVCNKLILREKIANLQFEESQAMAEDFIFFFECIMKVESCKKIPNTFYHYIQRANSATHSKTMDQLHQMVNTSYRILISVRELSPHMESYAIEKFLDTCLRSFPEMIRLSGNNMKNPIVKHNKSQMRNVLIRAFIGRKLSLRKIHGYLNALMTNFSDYI